MKKTIKMSRLVGEIEKAFRILNAKLFDNQLPTPVFTVVPTPRVFLSLSVLMFLTLHVTFKYLSGL